MIPNENVFGVKHPEWARRDEARSRCSQPLDPLGARRLALRRLPGDADASACACCCAGSACSERHRFDVVFDNQCLSWGLLGIRATGVPVVSVIHHPLHIDREADFAIDPSLVKKIKRTLYFPLLMQQHVAPRLDRIVTVSRGVARARSSATSASPRRRCASSTTAPTPSCSARCPASPKEADLLFVGRTEDRKKGVGTLLEALALLPRT